MVASKKERPSLDTYFMNVAKVIATRSTCRRHDVGAIAVRDKYILSTGYNGAPAGLQDCLELGCLRDAESIPSGERTEICRAVHAEENVIIQAALHGTSLTNATIYCTHSPCRRCAKMLINAHIAELVYDNEYADDYYAGLFGEAEILCRRLK